MQRPSPFPSVWIYHVYVAGKETGNFSHKSLWKEPGFSTVISQVCFEDRRCRLNPRWTISSSDHWISAELQTHGNQQRRHLSCVCLSLVRRGCLCIHLPAYQKCNGARALPLIVILLTLGSGGRDSDRPADMRRVHLLPGHEQFERKILCPIV